MDEPTESDQIRRFLADRHGAEVEGLESLDGGFWSSAYGYRVDESEFVLRLADSPEGFRADQAAHQFEQADLPIPEVLEVGTALGRFFAVSRRARGRFLEDVEPEAADRAGPMIDRLLKALRAASTVPEAGVDWSDDSRDAPRTWRESLRDRLADDPQRTVSGWRAKIACDPELDGLYQQTERRILDLLDQCPERRDLIHGDLLHQNVLVSDDARQINAVFSWKCSLLGDHLYDVAWLSFWEPWHPGIAAVDSWSRTVKRAIDEDDLRDAALRHHCYELHIGAEHLAFCSWTGNAASLAGVALRTAAVLARGPRSI